jgi:hypothetical protein
MITNFKIELDGIDFEFITMNRVRLHLYQVYVLHEGSKCRFHLQLEEDGKFHIADRPACPPAYYHLEDTMSEAILKLGKVA